MSKPKSLQGSMSLILLGMLLILSAETAMSATTSGIRINEVLFNPGAGGYQWVELKNSGTTAINIGGYRITNEAGAWYTIPSALPAVPSGAFVVVVFDGAGSESYACDFSDKVGNAPYGAEIREHSREDLRANAPFMIPAPSSCFFLVSWNSFQGTALSILSLPADFLFTVIPSLDASGRRPEGAWPAQASKAGIWSQRWLKDSARRGFGAGSTSAGPAVLSFVAWGGAPGDRAV